MLPLHFQSEQVIDTSFLFFRSQGPLLKIQGISFALWFLETAPREPCRMGILDTVELGYNTDCNKNTVILYNDNDSHGGISVYKTGIN